MQTSSGAAACSRPSLARIKKASPADGVSISQHIITTGASMFVNMDALCSPDDLSALSAGNRHQRHMLANGRGMRWQDDMLA